MSSPIVKTVIIICGPTAVGKTSAAIQLARHFKTEIISADSRQCFKELNIGVARPSAEELSAIKHHFIASHSIHEEVTAITFEQYALQKATELFQNNDIVVMVGGTGLYIKAFCEGLDAIPGMSSEVRSQIVENYNKHGLKWLQDEVQEKDPEFFAVGEIKNPQRMMRALEVMEATGQSILSFQKGQKTKRGFNIIKIGLKLPREELIRNIDTRTDQMMAPRLPLGIGLLDEVKGLTAFKDMNALQTVGYAEIFDHLEGKITLAEAVERIKINTRQYAKRQMTWFKKDEAIKWFETGQADLIRDWLQHQS